MTKQRLIFRHLAKPISFEHCDSSGFKKYKSIGLGCKSVEICQSISVVNSDNGETISELTVKGIKYGIQIRMCWINNDEKNDPPSYIVVGGCKPKDTSLNLICIYYRGVFAIYNF